MNVSFSSDVLEVGMSVNVNATSIAYNTIMLCAVVVILRLFTSGGNEGDGGQPSNGDHSFVYLPGGWVFQPPTYIHLCCGSARRSIPHEVRTVFPDFNQPPAGMCGECHLCHRPNCESCDRCRMGLRCSYGLCYFMDPMQLVEHSGFVFHHSVKFGYCGVCEVCTQFPCLLCGGCRFNTSNPHVTPPLMCSNRACVITGLPYGQDVSRFFHPYRGQHHLRGRQAILLLLPPSRLLSEFEHRVVDVAGYGCELPFPADVVFREPGWAPNGINPWITHRLPFVDLRLRMGAVGLPFLPAVPDPFVYRDNPLNTYPSPPPSR